MRLFHTAVLLLAALCCAVPTALGQGVYIDRRPGRPPTPGVPDNRMSLKRHVVSADITDTIAAYRIEQTFHNETDGTIEGTYLFPIPREAVATGLSLTINGKEVAGEVLDSGTATEIYRDIVRKMRDPALLEYADHGLLRASIFPIAPRSDVKIAIAFACPAERVGDLYALALPLKFAAGTGADLTVDVRLSSTLPLTTVYSPSHTVDVARDGDRKARVSFEGKPKGKADFLLYYARNESELGMSFLTNRMPAQDGHFLLVLAPRVETGAKNRQPRDVVFVLDRSGSMAGEKWEQATNALKYGLRTLAPEDRFALVSFATDVRTYKPTLVDSTKEEVEGAVAHLEMLRPAGGTNIAESLEQAMALLTGDSVRLRLVPFLTDGLPTIGEVDTEKILAQVAKANSARSRLFSFGVGYDVNTFLLDRLASDNQGASEYIAEGENIEVRVSSFFTKVAEPVLVAPRLDFHGLEVWDVYPQKLPDLFAGSSLVVTGRYRGEGAHSITLRGTTGAGERTFTAEVSLPKESRETSFLPALWAARKVGFLLNEIRLHGANQELIDAVIALGREYGIVTPYTSGLVVEEGMRLGRISGAVPAAAGPTTPGAEVDRDGAASWASTERRAREELERLDLSGDEAGASGRGAVEDAKSIGLLSAMGSADGATAYAVRNGIPVTRVTASGRTLLCIGDVHIDVAFEESMKAGMVEIDAFSDAYFELLDRHPELKALLALGTQLVFVLDGKAIRIK